MRLSWIALLLTLLMAATAEASAMSGLPGAMQKRILHRSGRGGAAAEVVRPIRQRQVPVTDRLVTVKIREVPAAPELVFGELMQVTEVSCCSAVIRDGGQPAASQAEQLPYHATAPPGAR